MSPNLFITYANKGFDYALRFEVWWDSEINPIASIKYSSQCCQLEKLWNKAYVTERIWTLNNWQLCRWCKNSLETLQISVINGLFTCTLFNWIDVPSEIMLSTLSHCPAETSPEKSYWCQLLLGLNCSHYLFLWGTLCACVYCPLGSVRILALLLKMIYYALF